MTHYQEVIKELQLLKKQHPTLTIGRHISTALSDYGDFWGITDKEFLFALQKYSTQLDDTYASEAEVDKIVRDAQDLSTILDEEEEDY